MMRKTSVRRITEWNFGHPHMATGFGQIYQFTRETVDTGLQRTTLENGVRVVSHDRGGASTTIGFYADAGVKYDPNTAPGLTHMAQHALLMGNLANSTFQIDRAFRAIGSAYGHAEIQKKYVGVWAQGNRSTWRPAVEHFSPAFAAPRFAESDLERFRDNLDTQREEGRWNFPREYAINELETLAYFKEPLGAPRIVPAASNEKCNTKALLDKFATYMTPNRITVVGVNVPHDELVAAYLEQPFAHSAAAPHHARANPVKVLSGADEKVQFYAGKTGLEFENRPAEMKTKPDYDQEGIVAVGWQTVGSESTLAEYAAALVYREMLAISTGETLENVFAQQPAHGTRAFYRPYSTAGLIGFTVRADPKVLKGAVDKALKTLPSDYVAHMPSAKARATTSFFSNHLETDPAYANFLASSQHSAEDVLAAISSASVSQVGDIAEGIRRTQPSMFATGDVYGLPTLKQWA